MWQDIFRLAVAWGGVIGIIAFWYRVMKNIETF